MTSTLAPQRNRYELQTNHYALPEPTGQVLDKRTGKFLNGPDGEPVMTIEDARDLHQEYIWS